MCADVESVGIGPTCNTASQEAPWQLYFWLVGKNLHSFQPSTRNFYFPQKRLQANSLHEQNVD